MTSTVPELQRSPHLPPLDELARLAHGTVFAPSEFHAFTCAEHMSEYGFDDTARPAALREAAIGTLTQGYDEDASTRYVRQVVTRLLDSLKDAGVIEMDTYDAIDNAVDEAGELAAEFVAARVLDADGYGILDRIVSR